MGRATGASPVLKARDAIDIGRFGLGALAFGELELAGTSEPGRAPILAATVAVQRPALGLGASAIAGLASRARVIAALVAAAAKLQATGMVTTTAADILGLKLCAGGGSDPRSLTKPGSGTDDKSRDA